MIAPRQASKLQRISNAFHTGQKVFDGPWFPYPLNWTSSFTQPHDPLLASSKVWKSDRGFRSDMNHSHFNWPRPSKIGSMKAIFAREVRNARNVFNVMFSGHLGGGLPSARYSTITITTEPYKSMFLMVFLWFLPARNIAPSSRDRTSVIHQREFCCERERIWRSSRSGSMWWNSGDWLFLPGSPQSVKVLFPRKPSGKELWLL